MPIKFRCSYCRQFLGISRGRAGGVVDCPTCGRSIRVPGLDGVAQPVPVPAFNVRDDKLMRALDELANWNAPLPVVATLDAEPEEEIPQPIAEPIPIEVPLPPEPVAVRDRPAALIEPGRGAPAEAAAEPAMSVAAALSELNQIAAVEPQTRSFKDEFSVTPRSRRRPRFRTLAAASLVSLIIGGGSGYWAAISNPRPGPPADRSGSAVPPDNQTVSPPAITGRITYRTADGSTLPDRTARVLILPRERKGTLKLSSVGLRAADDPADVRLSAAALRALGGDFALTDDGGNYEIQLPNPGTFHIVVLSNYATRGENDDVDPELIRLLTPYFEQPATLLGRTKVHFDQVKYRGGSSEIRDHAF